MSGLRRRNDAPREESDLSAQRGRGVARRRGTRRSSPRAAHLSRLRQRGEPGSRAEMIVRVHYPLVSGRLVLRTENDWEKNLEAVDAGASRFDFKVSSESPFFYFKPVILEEGKEPGWAAGENYLGLSSQTKPREVYPYFEADQKCSACDLRALASPFGPVEKFDYRVFYPPGYHENVLKRYPVLYMQDGQNLFFPGEAFSGRHWRIAETLGLLY